jgi:hypothetical protein
MSRIKVTINRDEWLRGTGSGVMCRARDGRKCCLQFLAEAHGVKPYRPPDTAHEINLPTSLPQPDRRLMPLAIFDTSPHTAFTTPWRWQDVFALANDDSRIDDATREQAIRVGFDIVLGCDVEFVGGES